MEPTIVDREQLILVGFSFFGDPVAESAGWTEENEIGRLWHRFMIYMEKYADRIKHARPGVGYEVHIQQEETPAIGHYEVFVGLEVEKLEDVPVELVIKMLPATQYAVFPLKGRQIDSEDWPLMMSQWMGTAGYQQVHQFGFQLYDERFKGLDRLEESEIDVYVPVERQG